MTITLDIPYHSRQDLGAIAERFLRDHGVWGTIPVPIEDIIDLQMGIDIFPIPGLLHDLDIDAFIYSDFSCIAVDEFIYDHRANRRRFSLAHEIAHAVLHRDVFSEISFTEIDEYKHFVTHIDATDFDWLEWQGYSFGAQVLVPTLFLRKEFELAKAKAEKVGISLAESWHFAGDYICIDLARTFEVSPAVIAKRIQYSKILSLPPEDE